MTEEKWDPETAEIDWTEKDLELLKTLRKAFGQDTTELDVIDALAGSIVVATDTIGEFWKELGINNIFPVTPEGFNAYLEILEVTLKVFNQSRVVLYVLVHQEKGLPLAIFPDIYWEKTPAWYKFSFKTLGKMNNIMAMKVLKKLAGAKGS